MLVNTINFGCNAIWQEVKNLSKVEIFCRKDLNAKTPGFLTNLFDKNIYEVVMIQFVFKYFVL